MKMTLSFYRGSQVAEGCLNFLMRPEPCSSQKLYNKNILTLENKKNGVTISYS